MRLLGHLARPLQLDLSPVVSYRPLKYFDDSPYLLLTSLYAKWDRVLSIQRECHISDQPVLNGPLNAASRL
jgi:hypothetical protein